MKRTIARLEYFERCLRMSDQIRQDEKRRFDDALWQAFCINSHLTLFAASLINACGKIEGCETGPLWKKLHAILEKRLDLEMALAGGKEAGNGNS